MWCECGYDFATKQLRPGGQKQMPKILRFFLWVIGFIYSLFAVALSRMYPGLVIIGVLVLVLVVWLIHKKKT
jgi:hypothetical protein